jgi:hypothetical protein
MMGTQSRFSFAGGLTALALALVAPQARGDVIVLQDLLNGASIRAGGLLYENFRGYGSGTIFGVGSQPGNPSNILVTSTDLGLTFTGLGGGPLVAVFGQGPLGARFTFDVVPIVPMSTIGYAAVDASGSLAPFPNANMAFIPPFFDASLSVVGAAPPPMNVNALLENVGTTTITTDVSAAAIFPGSPSLTVTESFFASGLTSHGFGSLATLSHVSISFVPEPSPLALVGAFGSAVAFTGWLRRRKRVTP